MIAENNRNGSLDILRIVTMLLVVGVHAVGSVEQWVPKTGLARIEYDFLDTINKIGVPLFFAISGWFILNKPIYNLRVFYFRRLKRILIPYICYAVLYTVYFVAYEEHQPLLIPKEYLLRLIEGRVHPTHWFIYTILALYFIAPFLSKMIGAMTANEKRILLAGILGYRLIATILNATGVSLANTDLYFSDTAILCFLIGGIARQIPIFYEKKSVEYAVLILGFIGYIATQDYTLMFIGICSGLCILRKVDSNRAPLAERISNQTYSIYLIHAAVISALLKIQRFDSEWIGIQMVLFVVEVFVISGLMTWMLEFIPKRLLAIRKKND